MPTRHDPRRGLRFMVPLLAAAVWSAAIAQPDVKSDVTRSPGQATATATATAVATITAIDAPKRHLTLKTPQGRVLDMTVGPEARNFEQLRVGDKVTVSYQEALTVSLKKGAGDASMKEREISERSEPGAKPGGTMGREVTVVAQVVAVNPSAQTVTVKGPRGRVMDLHVSDPAQLQDVKQGDRVQAVYTEAVAIKVEPGTGK
ncbi:hypothetical protein CUPL110328_00650 [Cupriavidus plantarum]|nr:hypothetical protein [Cupriavidus plantarum]REE91273.1 hypothetical protein C7418_4576 [Cupriavidus plantarum]CAG2139804.1 hypothetical protein LMG26296_02930 [Cupriavidus plantarum]SMR85665.1 hypothetical protein SAMN05421735_4472 [Cupriavidus plantarum]